MSPKKPIVPTEASYLKMQELKLQEDRLARREGLPHLYGLPWYSWQWNFFVSKNRMNLLTAANQIGKSTGQIRKCIDWATDKKKWPELWPKSTPRQFWYFYPSSDLATEEFETKWVPEFLPRGKFKDDPVYGWKEEYGVQDKIKLIRFNSGITVYFKTYEQKIKNLQASSVHAVFADEEMPEDFYPEVDARLSGATIQGYFNMVFTATLGQEFWRLAMEPKGSEKEKFPQAFKQQISLYDCMTYKNGTPGPWSEEMINDRIHKCKDDNEVQRRVYGRFVAKSGRVYTPYNPTQHLIEPRPVGHDWHFYAGIDHGSGGSAHPAAVCVIAVRPDYQLGYVYRFWRGDDVTTTAGDVLEKWKEMTLGLSIIQTWYDWEAKDIKTIAERQSENVEIADKSHERGEGVLNTLFKSGMLYIFDDKEGEGAKLSGEFIGLRHGTPKTKAKDDGIDSVRYACVKIPWDFTIIAKELTDADKEKLLMKAAPLTQKELDEEELRYRRGEIKKNDDPWAEYNQEFDDWNEMYG